MKKVIYIVSVLFLILNSCEKPVEKGEFGNPLIKLYGDALSDVGSSIAVSDKGFVICGTLTLMDRITNESGGREIVLGSEHKDMGIIITDKKGVQQKIINIGTPGVEDIGRKVLSYNGFFYCVGTATREHGGNPDKDVVVVKIDGEGEVLDTWYIGDEFNQLAFDIIPNNSNTGFIICGASSTSAIGELDFKVWEVDTDGGVVGTYDRSFEGDDMAIRIIKDHNQGYIIAGSTLMGNNLNIILIKLTNALTESDQHIYISSSNRVPADIALTGDGGYLVSGSSTTDGNIRGLLLRVETYNPIGLDETDVSVSISTFFGSYNSITLLSDNTTFLIAGSYDKTLGNLSSSENIFRYFDSDMNMISEDYITGGIGKQVVNDVVEDSGKLVAVGTNGDELRSLITFLKFDPWE